ncbi:hypothetical protein E4P41_16625 [Geodermatophilus sp. DF01-2]|uniref:hypothetical protein n=1 Tax=Geodermatophilus sp. DF01-2 TaxID=2559610 RepID=UPI001073B18D|nr:hypothetical protein [Geodermatophilus sp. DF01_2]TFV55848.1 hypothetical protein E4P41_16625 [Geodermatophilus sp. DF01_2]
MSHDLSAVVGPDGWVTWEALTARVDRKTVTAWLDSGRLLRLHRAVYALPTAVTDWRTRVEAAVRTCGGVVSHRSALALWGLIPPGGPVHLTVEVARSARGTTGIVLHRTRALTDSIRRIEGLPVSWVGRAVVDCWGRPAGMTRAELRAVTIEAVRRRLCSPRELRYELERRPCLPGRAALVELLRLLADGCRSELEIWGCLEVLRGPGMPPFVQQRRVTVAGRTFFLDAAYEDVLLAVEMDGATWHGSRVQRKRDISRDALLGTIGWQTLRSGYAGMTGSSAACRSEILAVRCTRLRLITGNGVR